MQNALSFDLEPWFCGHILAEKVPRDSWDSQKLRAADATRDLLEMLDKLDTKATFFVLGWLAEREPDLIAEIADAGHEIATHGYSHVSITKMKSEEFAADLGKGLEVLEKIVDYDIIGYRAPHFTITRDTMWAIDTLVEHGIKYDSSIFPIGFHPDYGIPDAKLGIFSISEGIKEVPLSVVKTMGVSIPCAGGAYFRLLPYSVSRSLLRKCNKQNRPIVFYLHPWEFDPKQPRLRLSHFSRLRHYTNLDTTAKKMSRLLKDFNFTSIRGVLGL